MNILVSTVDSDVKIDDLGGLNLTHPTVNINIATEYNFDKIKKSNDLQAAIDNNKLLVKIGDRIIKNIKSPFLDLDTKISDLLINYPDIYYMDFDFTLILSKVETKFDKGRKYERYYASPTDSTDLYVKKSYEDITGTRKINNVDCPNMLLGVKITVEWYNKDNTLNTNVKEINSFFNRAQAGEYLVKRRSRNTDNLKGMAEGTPAESYVTTIFTKYVKEIQEYVETGADSFKIALENETDQTMLDILNISLPNAVLNRVATIREIIINQIT
jgi:hypothetical protein